MRGAKELLLISLTAIPWSWVAVIKIQGIPEAIAQKKVPRRLQHADRGIVLSQF